MQIRKASSRAARAAVLLLLAGGLGSWGACGTNALPAATARAGVDSGSAYRVRYDQLGYPLEGERFAVVLSPGSPAPRYQIEDATTRSPVLAGRAGPRVIDVSSRAGSPLTGDRIDLTVLPPGRYFIVLEDGSRAGPVVVARDVYAPVVPLLTRFLAEQRCGPTSRSVSLHDACHLSASVAHAHSGDGVAVDDETPPPYAGSPAVNAEGGWHDAGDYLKFVGTTAYVLAVDLMALRDHPRAFGAAREALASELRWGLDWLVKMVAGPEPYHQVGGEGDHDAAFRRPEEDTQSKLRSYDQRPVFRMARGRGRNLLGRSAAAFVLGAQVYGARDLPYAQRLLGAAEAAYAGARVRDGVQNPVPPDFYAERSGDDDLVLAAAALARMTGENRYATDAYALGVRLSSGAAPLGWDSIDALALLEAGRAFPAGSRERSELARRLEGLAAPIAATATAPAGPGAPFGYALPAFGNGSIAESLGAAATCLAARRLAGTAGCALVARRQLHWLFGENPFGLSFLVGAGTAWPQNLHHGLAQAAHVTIPGAIAGGPTALETLTGAGLPAPPGDDPYAAWSTDALLYEDRVDDYVCNEPAIDFTAALVFVLAELEDGR